MTLNRNPEDYFVHIEQAAFEPSNLVPGIGPSPDKMLLGRLFSYPDTHRYRIGPNYAQLPPNRPHSAGELATPRTARCGTSRRTRPAVRAELVRRPGGRLPAGFGDPAGWATAGEMVREAYTLHREDDDFGQPGTHGPRGARRRGPRPAGRRTSPAICSDGVTRPGPAARAPVLAQRRQEASATASPTR